MTTVDLGHMRLHAVMIETKGYTLKEISGLFENASAVWGGTHADPDTIAFDNGIVLIQNVQ